MKMLCRQCRVPYENQLICPDCGSRLVYPGQGRLNRDALLAFAHSDAFPTVRPAGRDSSGRSAAEDVDDVDAIDARLPWPMLLGLATAAILALLALVLICKFGLSG